MSTILKEHGTYARYQQDQRMNVPSCDACKAASREYHRLWRVRTGKNRHRDTGCAAGVGWPHADPELARILRVREAAR